MSEYILDFFNVDKSLIILGEFGGSPFFIEIAEQKTVSVTTFYGTQKKKKKTDKGKHI